MIRRGSRTGDLLEGCQCWGGEEQGLSKRVHTHTHDRAPVVQHDSVPVETMPTFPHYLADPLIERLRERNMRDDPTLEESKRPDALRTIDNLVRDDEVTWLDLLRKTADGTEGDDGADAEGAERGDVGAGGDLVGREFVVEAVAGEEGDWDGVLRVGGGLVGEDGDGTGRGAPGGGDGEGGGGCEAGEGGEAGAAYDGDPDGLCCFLAGRGLGIWLRGVGNYLDMWRVR